MSVRDRMGAKLRPGLPGAALACVGVAALSIATAFRGSPGIGVLSALLVTGGVAWARRSWLGLRRPQRWARTIAHGLAAGAALQALSVVALDPLAEWLTGSPPDVSQFDGLRGDLGALATWLAFVWCFVVFVEEWVFRGLLVSDLAAWLGGGRAAVAASVLASSVVFGLAHAYQGVGGSVSTGVIGLALALLYVRAGWNLWPAVIAHGTIDTIGLWMIYADLDRAFTG